MGLTENQVIMIMLIAVIAFIVIVAISAYFLFFFKKTQKEINDEINEALLKQKNYNYKTYPGDTLLDFDTIYDNVICSDKSCSMIISCDTVTFDLMSENEKENLFYKYVSLYRNLQAPIQILVNSKVSKYDVRDKFNTVYSNIESGYRKQTIEYRKSLRSDTDSYSLEVMKNSLDRKNILLRYLKDFANYTQNIANSGGSIVTKNYYIVVSVTSSEQYQRNLIDLPLTKQFLTNRAEKLQIYLQNCGIKSYVLNQSEVTNLLYLMYNENDEKFDNFKEAVNAGFFKKNVKKIVNMQQVRRN